MEFNDLINIKLTQESGQTSQAPWKFDENKRTYNNVILINNIPVLLKISQENINSFSLIMWITLDKNIFIKVSPSNSNDIIKYLFERYPY